MSKARVMLDGKVIDLVSAVNRKNEKKVCLNACNMFIQNARDLLIEISEMARANPDKKAYNACGDASTALLKIYTKYRKELEEQQ